jgi:hypothetical protein
MILDLDTVLSKFFIKVFLEPLKPKGVAFLMLPIVISVFLKAIIREMHVVIPIRQTVVVTGRTHVALFVYIKFIFACKQRPDPQIKLPTPI